MEDETIRDAGTVYTFSDPPNTSGNVINHVTDREFDSNGDLRSVSVAGVETDYDWYTSGSNRGEINTITDAVSNTWTFQNYKRGTPRTEQSPIAGIGITRTVNDSGTIASVTDAEAKTTGYSYDDNNELSASPRQRPPTTTRRLPAPARRAHPSATAC